MHELKNSDYVPFMLLLIREKNNRNTGSPRPQTTPAGTSTIFLSGLSSNSVWRFDLFLNSRNINICYNNDVLCKLLFSYLSKRTLSVLNQARFQTPTKTHSIIIRVKPCVGWRWMDGWRVIWGGGDIEIGTRPR